MAARAGIEARRTPNPALSGAWSARHRRQGRRSCRNQESGRGRRLRQRRAVALLSLRSLQEIRDKLRRLLPSNIFVQILAGPPELCGGIFGSMLKLIALTTLVALPVLVLLLLQIQFLPFHDVNITNAQRAALFLDIVLLWLLRPPILADLSVEIFGGARVLARVLRDFGLAVACVTSIAALWFSIVVATIPGERQETALTGPDRPRWWTAYIERGAKKTKLVHDLLFVGDVDPVTRRRKSLFSNTLVLPGFNLFDALKIDDPKKLAWKEHLFDFRARHLEQAVLYFADFTKADLSSAHLQGVLLDGAKLQGASLEKAELQGASLSGAQLQGASLERVELQGGTLFWANLRGASLNGVQLQGARLDEAQLQGASLDGAAINATRFSGAFLWRTQWGDLDPADLGAVQLDATLELWKPVWVQITGEPVPWTGNDYAELREQHP